MAVPTASGADATARPDRNASARLVSFGKDEPHCPSLRAGGLQRSGVGVYFEWWDGMERRALVLDADRLTVGSAADNDVVVDDPSVSRVHAIVQHLNGRWFIEDCGSRNGTTVNGRRLVGVVAMQPDDDVVLGRARLHFRGQASAGGRPTDAVVARPDVTPREHDVLVALCAPLASGDLFTEPATVREMAATLNVTDNAVKLHLANLADKFSIVGPERRRSRLANAALDAGVVTLADLRGDK
jgi:hypothetical protein